MNLKSYLSSAITEAAFKAGKMAFISGPRQAGKTTLAKTMLSVQVVKTDSYEITVISADLLLPYLI